MADLRQRIYRMLGQNNHLKNNEIGKHFCKTKANNLRYNETDFPRSNRSTSFNGKNFKSLQNAAANCIGVSQRKQYDIVQSTTHYNFKKSWP